MSKPHHLGQTRVIQWSWVTASSSSGSKPDDAFFPPSHSATALPHDNPLHRGGCSSVAISVESKPLQAALDPCTDTLSGSGHSVSPGTKVQPFPCNVDLAGPVLLLAEDPQGSLAGIRAWGRVGNVMTPLPKAQSYLGQTCRAPVARRGGWRWKICSWR